MTPARQLVLPPVDRADAHRTRGTTLLLRRVRALLWAEMTTSGHAVMRTSWEHRGECPPAGCRSRCVEMRALLDEIDRRLGVER